MYSLVAVRSLREKAGFRERADAVSRVFEPLALLLTGQVKTGDGGDLVAVFVAFQHYSYSLQKNCPACFSGQVGAGVESKLHFVTLFVVCQVLQRNKDVFHRHDANHDKLYTLFQKR